MFEMSLIEVWERYDFQDQLSIPNTEHCALSKVTNFAYNHVKTGEVKKNLV